MGGMACIRMWRERLEMGKYESAFIAFSGDGEDKANAAFKALQRLGLLTRSIYHISSRGKKSRKMLVQTFVAKFVIKMH